MERIIGEIELDFGKDRLEGFHEYYCPALVDVMREGVCLNHVFPRVDVVFRKGVYQIRRWLPSRAEDVNKNNGGHHRAFAHAIEKKILGCNLFEEHCVDIPPWLSILEMREADFYDIERVNDALSYLPEEIRNSTMVNLCAKYDLKFEDFPRF